MGVGDGWQGPKGRSGGGVLMEGSHYQLGHLGELRKPTPSPGWGPRGQGPSKNRQGPDINNWTLHVKKNRTRPNGNPV